MHLRHTLMRFVAKAAPDLEAKPPPALSVEAGDAAKHKDAENLPELPDGSDEFPRGVHGEGRKQWYGDEPPPPPTSLLLPLPMSLLYNPSVDKRGSRYGDEGTRADIFENAESGQPGGSDATPPPPTPPFPPVLTGHVLSLLPY